MPEYRFHVMAIPASSAYGAAPSTSKLFMFIENAWYCTVNRVSRVQAKDRVRVLERCRERQAVGWYDRSSDFNGDTSHMPLFIFDIYYHYSIDMYVYGPFAQM